MNLSRVQLREAVPADSEFVFDVRRQAFRRYVEAQGGWDESRERQRHLERFGSQRFRVIVAGSVDVGYLATRVYLQATGEYPASLFLHQLMLLPAFQSQGIGSFCLRKLAEEGHALSLPVRLSVLHSNPRALKFYLAAGCTVVTESDSHTRLELSGLPAISLDIATPSDSTLLSNLLELYIHDLSDVFPDIELGPDGRFGYEHLPLYWSEPDRRFAFVIKVAGQVAGFALVRRGSPVVDDPDVLDVAEFFVIRRHRRSGVGRRAAFLLWNRLPGKWTVRVSEGNSGAVAFWRSVVAEFTNRTAVESIHPGQPNAWRVFTFEGVC